jgi:hypothetical protein
MAGTTSTWEDELRGWLTPFLDRLGQKARRRMTNRIPPFQTVIEGAHKFIPSRREGTASLVRSHRRKSRP